jgi:hypothetical protein
MNIKELLQNKYPHVLIPGTRKDIPKNKEYMVYVLVRNDKAVVVGHGQFNRAQVIFDDTTRATNGHIKAVYIRLYRLYGLATDRYERFILKFPNKGKAKAAESELHKLIGGNKLAIPDKISASLFAGLNASGQPMLLLKLALASAYSGFSDLRRWEKLGLINSTDAAIVAKKLGLKKL